MIILLHLFRSSLVQSIDTSSVRTALRALGAGVLFCVICSAFARGDEPAAAAGEVGANASPEHAIAAPSPAVMEASAPAAIVSKKIEELTDTGVTLWRRGQRDAADRSFAAALAVDEPPQAKRALLLTLADLYLESDEPLKSIAVLEKLLALLPADSERPQLLLRLGRLYRSTGAHGAATTRFFQVINSTMRMSPESLESFRRSANEARLEIAETFAGNGQFEEAGRYFNMLQVLDLSPEERERVGFRRAQLRFGLNDWPRAERELGEFLASYPTSAYTPEARYMRARSLHELGRKDDAVREVVELLRSPDGVDTAQARLAGFWKRRTGNELANQFYEQGDFIGALQIYQALARASAEPSWRWPAVYQIGLCFERLKMPERAAEAYEALIKPEPALPPGTRLPDSLSSLQGMAKWRREHLVWVEQAEKQFHELTAVDATAGS